jgi:hypothetical protein
MAGNALAGLAARLGMRASNAIGGAKGSVFGVAQEAVKGQYAAEAQERAHVQTKAIHRQVLRSAGQGTRVDIHVNADGTHTIGHTTEIIGEKMGKAREAQAVKDFKASNRPSRDANGFRRDQPDHVGNAKGAIENRGMAPTTIVADKTKGAISAPKSKAKTAATEEVPDNTRQFVNDPKDGTRSVDRKDSSFAANLAENESKYLAEKTARLNTIKQAGTGIKPTTATAKS